MIGEAKIDLEEPAWLVRLSNGNGNMSEFVAKEIARDVKELMIYKRAMESMANQMVNPKMTALEMAELQLRQGAKDGRSEATTDRAADDRQRRSQPDGAADPVCGIG